jgi:hypothetical protein
MENSTPAKNYADMTFHLKGNQIPTSKGQFISNGLFGVILSTKNPTKFFKRFLP